MKTVLVMLVLAACGPRAAPTAPSAPPPADASVPDAPLPITRLVFGGWPGSNTHRWGTRFLELRRDGDQTRVRLHDEIHFQGVGMQPHQMPPTRHSCSRWEPVPETIEIPAECRGTSCDEIRAWLADSKVSPVEAC
jgi:hypothetical protein